MPMVGQGQYNNPGGGGGGGGGGATNPSTSQGGYPPSHSPAASTQGQYPAYPQGTVAQSNMAGSMSQQQQQQPTKMAGQ